MNTLKLIALIVAVITSSGWSAATETKAFVLTTAELKDYVTRFNADDEEMFSNIKNKDAYAFLENNIPLFDCPDEDFRRTYYFRWWMYRKHVKKTEDGYVVTEFMPPVGWAGKHNTISCPAAHHFYEGRWLHDPQVMDEYATFWLRKGGALRSYSFWIADAYYNRNLVTPNDAFLIDLLPDLIENYKAWEAGWLSGRPPHQFHIGQRENGLFYTSDDRDGGEVSIGGYGFRPTLNSFMYGDAKAIAAIARIAGKPDIVEEYEQKATTIKKLIQEKLWDKEAQFFKILLGSRLAQKEDSGDEERPRHTWWAPERLGGEEWVQYDFEKPVALSGSEVLWYHKINPNGKSGCAVPESWRLEYQKDGNWHPATKNTDYATAFNQYNRVSFEPVTTSTIRLSAKTKPGFSAGILEWRVFANEKSIAATAKASASYTDKFAGTLAALNDEPESPRKQQHQNKRTTKGSASGQEKLRDVRELYGYTPWYFNLPDPGYEAGWKELMDPKGFYAKFGPTFAEQRHPEFKLSYEGHECQWNGPSWPLATCSVLTALANLLNNYDQDVIGKDAYFETLKCYTRSHQLKREDGKIVPWIDENIHPYTGDWIARTRLHDWAKTDPDWAKKKGGHHRGKDYNHSTYNDLIITGLVGLRPRADNIIEVNPLIPENTWDYFCLDNVLYHGRVLTIIWDKTGKKYKKGRGLSVFADGERIVNTKMLARITVAL